MDRVDRWHRGIDEVSGLGRRRSPDSGRPARQRTTEYGTPSAERLAAAHRFTGTLPSLSIRAV